MRSSLLFLIGYPLLLILLITIISAVVLGIGTVLTFLFAVSVWEASLVVVVVAAGVFWLHFQDGFHDHLEPMVEYPDAEPEEELPPRVTVTDFVVRPNRSRRRRKR
jgi:hypothetical protein